MALFLCLLPPGLWADSHTWTGGGADAMATTPANWGGTAPIGGDAIVLDATSHKNMTWNMTNMTVASWSQIGYLGTVTVATVYGTTGFTNLNITGNCIISNGMWTHLANTTTEANRLKATIGGNLSIGPNGAISATNGGFTAGWGPGYGNGASHGGRGNPGWSIGPCYGSITSPTNLGSGGNYAGCNGGGAIWLTVAGTLRNDGLIGADGKQESYYAASGGSVYLIAGALTGSGTIRAHGGNTTGGQGAGGGGRIAVVLTTPGADFSGFTGTISAFGGFANSKGCAGTVYLEKQSDIPGRGELIVNNSGGGTGYAIENTDLNGVEAVSYEFSRITLTNNGILNIGANDILIVTNTVLVGAGGLNNGIWISGGTLRAPSVFVYSNMFIGISATGSTFNPSTSLTIGTNAELRLDKPHAMTGDVIVAAGGNMTHTANGSTEAYKLNLTIKGSLTVQAGGGVDVTAKGFLSNYGPGTHPVNSCGGSYGGLGVGGLACYGSIVAPTNLGSGGRGWGGAAGGAIQLAVSGVVSNGGRICANPTEQQYRTGSGGSIYILAGVLTGACPIQANSATNVAGDSPGGGGRVALVVTNAGAGFSGYPTNMITAFGGRKAAGSGGAGTVYLRAAGQGVNEGILIVDNNNFAGLTTEISSNVTDAMVGDVILRNKGFLGLATNQTLTLIGIWSNAANLDAQWGSQVIFAGPAASTSIVYGSNAFMGLTCTNAGGKTLLFEAGKTNAISAQGRLMLRGSITATNLFLRSTDGTPWKLNVNALADQSVINVDVTNSDALPGVGAAVVALNSRDRGGNSNWVFMTAVPGETNTWTGNDNTIWSSSGNWSLARPPLTDDFILIPSDRPRYPTLDNHRIVNGISIQAGASLSLAGYNLTVKQGATVAGLITASGTETITFQTNANFTGGAFTAVRSTISLTGSGPQSVNLANLTFFKVNVANTNAIIFGNGFSATELRCEAASGTRNITFQQGTTVTLRDLVLLGSAASTNIALRSSSTGQPWNLAVSGYRSVCGVDVRDSNAGYGLPIPASSSKDSGNNPNWLFNANWSVWLGTNGTSFHTTNNWSPAGVPDASSRVRVDSANPMVITSAVTILDLIVGGGVGKATGTVNAALTVLEDIVVLTNGTLALNQPTIVNNGLFVLGGGTLTHSGPQNTEVNKLDVTVYGNVGVDMNGAINVAAKGYAGQKGPGAGGGMSASHGGRGDWAYSIGPCYGSIVSPTNLGSGGAYGYCLGGGAIRLIVSGTLRNDGLICADGVNSVSDYYSPAGGSIFLTAGMLIGSGTIRSHGGNTVGQGAGGGGRISLVVRQIGADFMEYTGSISAFSGLTGAGAGRAGAGTIYMQRAVERQGRGMVSVNNNNLALSGYTDVPPSPPHVTNEVKFATFIVTNAATLRLTNDFAVGNVFLTSANAKLDLGFNTLKVNAKEHPLGLGVATNYGAIIWIADGTIFTTW